jgi:hypothetical protein
MRLVEGLASRRLGFVEAVVQLVCDEQLARAGGRSPGSPGRRPLSLAYISAVSDVTEAGLEGLPGDPGGVVGRAPGRRRSRAAGRCCRSVSRDRFGNISQIHP